jgi:two-component system sensor histidine kinase ChvG
VLDARGRLAGRFEPSRRRDEVGDLARSLGDLSRDLERRVGLLESFASDVAHELRNPLASMRSAVELALSVEEPAQRSRLLESAIEDTRRMERLLAGVREVSLLDAGAAPEAEETVDVREAAGHVVEAVGLARPGTPVRLAVEGGHASVRMPPGRLAQVIANLVENAVDFSPHDGLVRVAVSLIGGGGPAPTVVISVTDEGPGIPGDVIDRIFDRFYTWRPGREAGPHAGLGLAIVKAIVEGRGGSVRAESLPGRGARFEVRLPAAPDQRRFPDSL